MDETNGKSENDQAQKDTESHPTDAENAGKLEQNGTTLADGPELVEVMVKDPTDTLDNYDGDSDETKIVQDLIIEDEFHGKDKRPETRLG